MPIQFRCNTCRKLLSVARRKAGYDTECPVCGSKTRVPDDIPETPSPETPSPPVATAVVNAPSAPGQTAKMEQPLGSIGAAPASKPSGTHPKRAPGSSGILEIDPDRLFGKAQTKNHGTNPSSLEKPARELSDYFEAIDQAQSIDDSGSQAIEVPEPFLPKPNSWQLRLFAVLLVLALSSALVVGFLLIRGW